MYLTCEESDILSWGHIQDINSSKWIFIINKWEIEREKKGGGLHLDNWCWENEPEKTW